MSGIAFVELTEDSLSEILSSARTRGIYQEVANDFLGSDTPGAEISLSDGPFKGKKANTVKQGFSNVAAKDDYKNRLRVVATEDRVVLINKELA